MSLVTIVPHNESHVIVRTDLDVAHEIKDTLTFEVPGAKFTPRYRIGAWDGTVSLFNPYSPYLAKGLIDHVIGLCEKWSYELKIEPGVITSICRSSEEELAQWARDVTPAAMETRGYQIDSFVTCVMSGRRFITASTSSGKTLMMYRLGRWYSELTGKPTLVLTTRKNLVAQAGMNFTQYDPNMKVSVVKDGVRDYKGDDNFVISTWQSALRSKPEWYEGFGCILADEAHSWDSSAFQRISKMMTTNKYRFGLSGSLDGSKINRLTLEGTFGRVHVASTNAERIADGSVARPKITMVRLQHTPENVKKAATGGPETDDGKKKPMLYPDEVRLAVACKRRARFLIDLCNSLRGNTLVLFHLNDAYGLPLWDAMQAEMPDKHLYFVNGSVDVDDRMYGQKMLEETPDGVVMLASLGTFSEGMSVNNIKNVVFAYPMKSRNRVLQSIGRGIRKMEGKDKARFYDLVDDMRKGRRSNVLWKHALERCDIYDSEGFDYKWTEVDLSKLSECETFEFKESEEKED